MSQNRIERYSKVRTLLDSPYEQRPTPHQILNQMLMVEQGLNLRMTVTGKPWNLISTTLETEAETSEYDIEQPVSQYQYSGKVHFVLRSTDRDDMPYLPVPFDDFSEQDYGQMPPAGHVNPALMVPEKISFYRQNIQNQTYKAVIAPTPQEVLTYTIYFLAGSLDRSQALMEHTGPLTELSDYCDLKTALALLYASAWSDDESFNTQKRKEVGASLAAQIGDMEPVVQKYLSQINGPKSFDMDHSFENSVPYPAL